MPILQLPVRLTREEVVGWVRSTQSALAEALSAGEPLQIDASALKQFDSAALAALLAVRREAEAKGIGFGVSGMSATLQSLADVYGIEELFAPPAAR
ncbi:STAS domain-containing protein [Corticibacter populi]|uniref:STAS domain-containing protein n=1 Tax=Corticibacter populi TaxID=1550736 RepID=A0A3M6QM81_9BURK|nr:STAS domain-containing protein [Corticibacter populi]RMX04190.1 STAS domain-containing protein [Corticibacter populi]RZS33215.1 phospholipid transport system transporter-binding protein [Corticibacter populi]